MSISAAEDDPLLDPLLTVKEVARLLRCSPMTVYRRCADDTLPGSVRFGRCLRIPRSAVEAVLNPDATT